jgi:hypothetical protein
MGLSGNYHVTTPHGLHGYRSPASLDEVPRMVEIWEPTEDHDKYMDDSAYLERRFGVRPLLELLAQAGVVGVARITMMPSFSPESIHTLTYRAAAVSVEAVHADYSLWSSLNGGEWRTPTRKDFQLPLDDLQHPLNRWNELREVAKSAPTVRQAIIEGRAYATCDGVGFRHHLVDQELNLFAEWSNPTEMASNHVSQMILVNAYNQVFRMCGGPVFSE